MSRAVVPHLAFPFRVEPSGEVATLEQDSLDEIAQNVEVLLRYRAGDLIENLDFGVTDLTFTVGTAAVREAIIAQVALWEPRATVLIDAAPDTFDELIEHVVVRVTGGIT